MTQIISVLTRIDKDAQRRKALAKIYSLLIKLAEEKENADKDPEKTVPLKSNIPPRQ